MRTGSALLLLLSLPAAAITSYPSAARACSCMRAPPPLEAAQRSAVVFEGRTNAPVVEGTQHRYTFEVIRTFKGDAGATVELITNDNSAACGRVYEPGQLYVIYASENAGQLADGLCSRSRLSSDAAEDFAALGEGTSAGASDNDTAEPTPPAEPPRIEESPPEPPPVAPSSRGGCAVGVAGLPHAPTEGGFALFTLLGVASLRRRAYRDGRNRSRRLHVARSVHDSPPCQ